MLGYAVVPRTAFYLPKTQASEPGKTYLRTALRTGD